MTTLQRGFTMVEMMAVLAVIAILAMLAVPSYMDGIVRQQVEAALALADIAKKPIGESWTLLHVLPSDNAAVGLPVAEKVVANYVSSLSVQDGAIHLIFGNRVHSAFAGKVLTLRPAVVEDASVVPVAWVCGHAEAPDKMAAKGANRTNIPDSFLPLHCRTLKR